ncbi:fumarylacetoacetate hydrolase family protein [Hyphococcus luteus]|uniref:2-hydroxyhepta-2,4-diene-1,7-dioate isomerase n=1 Tax=Hyphococcus luteus TaxID=2058213 RepID=A0A2S7K5E4_9PROT|nr:fumarylacetoacetate hydrolase family protein [Marinicaulis flavus]PQA87668.1 2-hydroxyhepta-2,4-diene-1,7-dioate isomerase [Marinicaulis flavus]
MKFVRYEFNGQISFGVVRGDAIVSLEPLIGELTLEDVIADWANRRGPVARYVDENMATDKLSDVRLLAPIADPPKIVGIGANYPRFGGGDLETSSPVLFLKPKSSIAGPFDPIILPPEAPSVIGEVELAIVIGKPGHRIAPSQAVEHIFGFMTANDVTAPEILLGESHKHALLLQQARGKGFPGFCPTGPWIETIDAASFPPAFRLEQRIGDDLEIEGNTADMVVGVSELVADISCAFGLQENDIILTGSPPPLGGKRIPLRAGDILRTDIDGVGSLANPIVRL